MRSEAGLTAWFFEKPTPVDRGMSFSDSHSTEITGNRVQSSDELGCTFHQCLTAKNVGMPPMFQMPL